MSNDKKQFISTLLSIMSVMRFCLMLAVIMMQYAAYAQINNNRNMEGRTKKAVYLQALGNGGIASILFDGRFTDDEGGLGASVGLGVFVDEIVVFGNTLPGYAPTLPIEINYLLGSEKHFFEVGGGFVFNSISVVFPTLGIGYRYYPSKGVSFRAGLAFPLLAQASIGWVF